MSDDNQLTMRVQWDESESSLPVLAADQFATIVSNGVLYLTVGQLVPPIVSVEPGQAPDEQPSARIMPVGRYALAPEHLRGLLRVLRSAGASLGVEEDG